MDKIYRIGSFNLRNIGVGAFANSRNLEKITNIILKEKMDVVALQEVLTDGKIFTKEDLPSSITKSNIITYLGGPDRWGFEWACSGDESIRHEGYAFLWNKDRLRLSSSQVTRNGRTFERIYSPRMIQTNGKNMKRKPYFARFTPQGRQGGSSFEIRLLCVHTYFGDDNVADRTVRQNEIQTLLTDVYPQVSDRIFQNAMPSYTVLLGDYNAELVTEDNRKAVEERNVYRRQNKIRIPAVISTDGKGYVHSDKYGVDVVTVQDQLTTLKTKKELDSEEYLDRGYASNYDHFSYDENAIGHVIKHKPRRIDAVRKYCGDDFEEYFKTISDHIPIIMELQIN